MRKDISEAVRIIFMKGIKPIFSKIARKYNCDSRTIKQYYTEGQSACTRKLRLYTSIIEPYAEIVREKIATGASTKAIHLYLKNKRF